MTPRVEALKALVDALLSEAKTWTYAETVDLWDVSQPLGKEIEARLRLADARYKAANS